MEAKPVQHSEQPRYPTRREVLAGAASFALLSLTGCDFTSTEPEKGKITVAPIFKHGEGRGATGCLVVSPPVFLSEEEAVQTIREELAKQGIHLKAGRTLESIRIPSRTLSFEVVKKDGKEEVKTKTIVTPGEGKPLKLDGIDSTGTIQVEFISERDVDDLGGPSGIGTVESYDLQEDATYVAEQVRKQGKDRVFFGIFYDPLSEMSEAKSYKEDEELDWEAKWKKREKQAREESSELLRQQAQDFVAWLKEQKAIP